MKQRDKDIPTIDAAVNHTPLIIFYKTYKGKELTSTLHPYHVKQYNNRCFLFGYEDESGKIANKALDRIQHISLANVPFKVNTSIDFAHFFDDVVGVSIPYDNVEKETIILRFTEACPQLCPQLCHKSCHKTKKRMQVLMQKMQPPVQRLQPWMKRLQVWSQRIQK